VKDTKPNTVLLIGMGGLGSIILELLAREPGLGRIVVAGLNEERALQRCNLARLSAMAQGHAPVVTFVPFDLNRKNMVIQAVLRAQPDLILNTATRQDWWLPDLLPPQEAARIWSAGSGVWLPVHMTLTLKLMQALRDAQFRGPVITTPFPDVINPVLSKLGLAPKCGIGSLAEIVPKLDDAVDLVIAGHTNDEFVCEIDGKWVTMADNAGRLFTAHDGDLGHRPHP